MNEINANIGKKLRKLRIGKGYSLGDLEEIAGVSKSMLGQIERGKTNPTVKTLWKVARSLNVPFSFFIEEETSPVKVFSPSKEVLVSGKKGRYRVYPLMPLNRTKNFEIYLMEIEPGYSYKSEPHSQGVEEFVMVKEGILRLTVNSKEYKAREEEIIHFPGDRVHIYHNISETPLKAYVLVCY
ncbi:helix-turn-helix domain-containing protein [Halothermothrix orenii]|uniref:Transcriptional regulator, XRE family n=1 Tax=Halothermothrix orenii (strain H 168 / OCM 544 / DSM 9562) TaxID=373903 RepID=B8D0X7_HALOH|nr:XRE family transcriptional regulator [Halothermothrix orenii]ACL68946.1 transcriptional regulator, XRE family [Halothermothrix orenii H 168]